MNRSERPRSGRIVTGWGITLACWLAVGVLPAGAISATDQQLLGSPNAEIFPAANTTMLAWSENSRAHPRFFNLYVRPIAGGHATRLNAQDTRGFTGGFDGSKLIFQQISKTGQSDLRIYDTGTKQFVTVPPDVNTARWEADPTMTDAYILFLRETARRNGYVSRLILHRIANGHEEVLDSVVTDVRRGPFMSQGQVNGDFVTWTVCSQGAGCNVFLHTISTDHTQKIADRQQEYASSVASDGTVFFIRSAVGCGNQARLMRYVSGTAELVRDFAKNRDTLDTYAVSPTQLVRDVLNCRTNDVNVNETTIT